MNNGGEQHSAEYRKLNPQGEVPTLVHDGKVIAQSFAIIEYLDEVFPERPLFPKDPYGRAKIRQFCENINSSIHPLGNLKVQQYLEKQAGFDADKKMEWARHWNLLGVKALEEILKDTAGKYCFGDQITAADLFLIPLVFAAKRVQVDFGPFPLITKIDEECSKLEAFQKAHPQQQIDFQA